MIFTDFFKAVAQFTDARFRSVLWRGIGLTIALLVAVYAAFLWVVQQLAGMQAVTDLVGDASWVGGLLSVTSLFVMVFLSIFLMVPVASAITSLFLDEVATAVEDRHYPHLAPAPRVAFWEGLKDSVNFLGVLIGANVLALAIYVILPFSIPFLFVGLNGYLLGREYFQIAAMRRLGREGARTLRRAHGAEVWFAGVLMTLPLMIPFVNLLVPILGAATFTHLFHRVNR